MMPGPLLTATIGASARRGPAAGPLFIAGHGILELALLCALLYGLGPFLTATPRFYRYFSLRRRNNALYGH